MPPTRDDFALVHPVRVRWGEVDRQDVVFNPNYFVYFDVAIGEYWRAAGVEYPDGYVDRFGADMFAVKSGAEFHAPARFDELLDVGCRVSRIGRTSMTFRFGIWRDRLPLTSGEIVYVNVDVRTGQPAPWPDLLRDSVLRFEKVPPERGPGPASAVTASRTDSRPPRPR